MNAIVIANPFAGTGRGRLGGDQAVDLLRERGVDAVLHPTGGAGDATRLAAAAADAGAELVVAVGGDGTVHETAMGLVGTGTAMGVLPSGSGNDFAMGIGCGDVASGLDAITAGRTLAVDVAHIDGDRYINSLGLFGAGRISGLAATYWRFLGSLRYSLATVVTLARYRGQPVEWTFGDGERREGIMLMAEICNGPTTGGGFRLAPDAALDDGWLDSCLIAPLPALEGMRQVPRAARGEHLDHPAVTYRRDRELRFHAPDEVAYHRDGEPGVLPAGEHVVGLVDQKLLVRVAATLPITAPEAS